MAAKNTVTLTFAGDASGANKAAQSTESALKDVGKQYDTAAHRAEGFADASEGVTKNTRGGKDVLDGFSDSMEALGVSLPGPIGNIAGLAGGVADMADGMGTLAAPAIAKMSTAMKAMNLTFLTSPIGLVVIGLVALTAAFIVAYKKSETFRNIVNGTLSAVADGVKALGRVFADVAGALFWPYKVAFNAIAGAWNNTVGRLSFSIPGWVPGVGGKGFDVPDIPTFAKGGQTSGLSLVGERGPELFAGKGTIIPHGQSMGMLGGGQPVVIQFEGPSDPIFEAFKKQVRIRGGVTAALGA